MFIIPRQGPNDSHKVSQLANDFSPPKVLPWLGNAHVLPTYAPMPLMCVFPIPSTSPMEHASHGCADADRIGW